MPPLVLYFGEMFPRQVVSAEKQADADKMPWLIYFQGGPGFGSPPYTT